MPAPDTLKPERWIADAGEASVAQLDIPPDALRERRFEVFCSLSVARAGPGDEAWHEMHVLVNGLHEWLRREATHADGRDSLDYSFRRSVPPGQALRVSATTELHRARQLGLRITAEEEVELR